MQKRPKSGHIPGWKEGLPESMKRPRSAVASRALNRFDNAENLFTNFIQDTVKTLNIGTPRPATVAVLNLKQFNFTMK